MTYHEHKLVDWTDKGSLILPGEVSVPLREWRRRNREKTAQLKRIRQLTDEPYNKGIKRLRDILDPP